jgi:hypothetical protein
VCGILGGGRCLLLRQHVVDGLRADPTLTSTSASFAGNFTGDFGAGTLTYALTTAGGFSGLVDTRVRTRP